MYAVLQYGTGLERHKTTAVRPQNRSVPWDEVLTLYVTQRIMIAFESLSSIHAITFSQLMPSTVDAICKSTLPLF